MKMRVKRRRSYALRTPFDFWDLCRARLGLCRYSLTERITVSSPEMQWLPKESSSMDWVRKVLPSLRGTGTYPEELLPAWAKMYLPVVGGRDEE